MGALNQPVVQLIGWTSSAMISPGGRVLKLHAWVHKLTSNAAWISDYTVRTCMQDGKPLTAASSDMNSVCCLPTCCLLPYCQVLLSSCVKPPLGSTPLSTEICLCYCGGLCSCKPIGRACSKCSACLNQKSHLHSFPPSEVALDVY